jgi:serine/threonine protein kinase
MILPHPSSFKYTVHLLTQHFVWFWRCLHCLASLSTGALQWVPRGSLGDMLEDKSQELTWGDPLLRLAMDLARGMAYLHGREYFDERANERKKCILHRDLKPDNALVSVSARVPCSCFVRPPDKWDWCSGH